MTRFISNFGSVNVSEVEISVGIGACATLWTAHEFFGACVRDSTERDLFAKTKLVICDVVSAGGWLDIADPSVIESPRVCGVLSSRCGAKVCVWAMCA